MSARSFERADEPQLPRGLVQPPTKPWAAPAPLQSTAVAPTSRRRREAGQVTGKPTMEERAAATADEAG